ncbi:hypothetical protein HYV88_05730 [Candidatus Woesearchaeota archaeon]|nr:hypothetical protein [Candidatus Woesearchaeota archaeon]
MQKKRSLIFFIILLVILTSNAVYSISIFFDGFESGNLTEWILTNAIDASNWTISSGNPYTGVYHIEARPRENTEPASIIKKAISTLDYDNLSVSYYRRLINLDGSDEFKSYWYDGLSWIVLEQTGSNSEDDNNYIIKSFNLNNNATNNANFQIKFECTANSHNEYCRIDNVNISGMAMTTTSTTSSSSSTTSTSQGTTTTTSTTSTSQETTTTTEPITTTTTIENSLIKINSLSPLDNSTWDSSNDVLFQYNVTSVSNITYCSLIINNTIDQEETNISKDIIQTFTKTLPNSDYLWAINCSDDSNITKSSETFSLLVNFIPSNPTTPNNVGGGGSSNRITNPQITPTETQVQEETPVLNPPASQQESGKKEDISNEQNEPIEKQDIISKKEALSDKIKNLFSLTGNLVSEKTKSVQSQRGVFAFILMLLLLMFGLYLKPKNKKIES